MRTTTTRRPSPLRILRAHVQAKADVLLGTALWWQEVIGDDGANERLIAVIEAYREARALLDQVEGTGGGT